MATYVLVRGGGHGGWCYQPVARMLRSERHEVYAPSLTGLGERAHLFRCDVDLDCHITDIVTWRACVRRPTGGCGTSTPATP
jgi:hypothetical protein